MVSTDRTGSGARTMVTGFDWLASPAPLEEGLAPARERYRIARLEADSLVFEEDRIAWVGRRREYDGPTVDTTVDCAGGGVTPGLIDFHAHPVFAATREAEFNLRTRGASYSEIAAAGGGILNSTTAVAAAKHEQLVDRARPYLDRALAHGTTTLEAKSGYGLSLEGELKLLRAIRELAERHALDLVPTFLGAHEYPQAYKQDHEGYIRIVIDEMIPAVVEEKLAVACDIFCETGVFSIDEARRILTAAKLAGLQVKVHADQLSPLGGTKLAVELEALSADHIEFIDEETVALLAGSSTVAGLLPVAAHFLRMEEDPPVRDLIESGAACALATDFNPGSSMCENMQMALHLAAIRFRVSAEEALWMATAGSAMALRLRDRGWIEPGALADLVVWDARSLDMLPYHFGVNQAKMVFKRGELVARDGVLVS